MVSTASAMACSKASRVRTAWARKIVFTFDQHSSIGGNSGEYGEIEHGHFGIHTGGSDTDHLMRLQIIQNDNLPGAQLREQDGLEKGQKDVAISKTGDRHGRDKPITSQGP